MKNINLLPEWYLNQQRDKHILHVRIALIAALAIVMGLWVVFAQAQMRVLVAERDATIPADNVIRDLSPELAAADANSRRMKNLQLAYRDVGNTVPMSRVLQQVQNNMTAGMALSRATIDVHNEPVKNAGMVGDTANPPKYHDVAHFTVVGVAPNDVLIAQMIGKLSNNPLFNDIALNYTRTEILRDYNVRRFEIQMTIDLDRLTTEDPTNQQKSELHEAVQQRGPQAASQLQEQAHAE